MMEPKIRFKGFDSRLDKSLIGDICHISTGKSNTQDKKDDGIYPFYVRSPHIERSNKYLYDEEAVLTVGDGVGTGKVFHYVNGKYDLHQRVYRMFNFKDINAKYFYYLFSQKFYKRVMSMTAKSSVDSVRLEMISKMEIEYPSINEQETIANYFTSLDSQISASTSRLTSLKQMKAASLQAMFPQEGETVPKIRFKGFEGEWKKVKVYDIVGRFRTGKLDANAMVLNGKYRFYTCAKDYFRIDTYAFDEEALLISGNGENVGYIHYYKGKFNAYQRTYVLTDFSQNILFIKSYLEAKLKNRINKEKSIGSTPYIRIDTIRDMDISIPESKVEQQAIASYFTSLDRQISLQSQRLEKLKQIKSACLDKMFV